MTLLAAMHLCADGEIRTNSAAQRRSALRKVMDTGGIGSTRTLKIWGRSKRPPVRGGTGGGGIW